MITLSKVFQTGYLIQDAVITDKYVTFTIRYNVSYPNKNGTWSHGCNDYRVKSFKLFDDIKCKLKQHVNVLIEGCLSNDLDGNTIIVSEKISFLE